MSSSPSPSTIVSDDSIVRSISYRSPSINVLHHNYESVLGDHLDESLFKGQDVYLSLKPNIDVSQLKHAMLKEMKIDPQSEQSEKIY
mmetsp:Transcript_873/g.1367  ORF Transcript_873/g.1367 Transcript_873/m.1367 type:complete len:87 (-) Transcript_873:639-899(-)